MWLGTAVSYSISVPVILPFIFLTGVIREKGMKLLLSFAAVNMLLCSTSFLHGLIFTINSSGELLFGALSMLPFGLTALCCIFYYLFYTAQILSRDALTNALNRHSFYKVLAQMKKRQMYLVSMDLNGLKEINDTKGHTEGDRAILAVAESALAVLPIRFRFYRMGGDEFEILCPNAEEQEIAEIVKKIKEAVQKRGYSVAAGYGKYRKDMKSDSVFTAVDAMMYEDKAQMKAKTGGTVR